MKSSVSPNERLVNLVLKLSHSAQPLSAREIKYDPNLGYDAQAEDAAFNKMFARDRERLKEAGFIIRCKDNKYSLDSSASFVYDLELSDLELAGLRELASSMIDDPYFPYPDDLRFALNKLEQTIAQPITPEEEDALLFADEFEDEDEFSDKSPAHSSDGTQGGNTEQDTYPDRNSAAFEAFVAAAPGPIAQEIRRTTGRPESKEMQAAYQEIARQEAKIQENFKKLWIQLEEAILDHKELRFDYLSESGEKSSREVQPAGSFTLRSYHYLLAFDLDKNDFRVFNLEGIKNCVTQKARKPFNFSQLKISDFMGLPFQYGAHPAIEVELFFHQKDAWRARTITQSKGSIRVDKDGNLIWTIDCKDPNELIRFCLTQECKLHIIRPDELSRSYLKTLKEMQHLNSSIGV